MNDTNENKTVELKAGSGFAQGIFIEYGITFDDDVTDIRNGGFGSTTKQRKAPQTRCFFICPIYNEKNRGVALLGSDY